MFRVVLRQNDLHPHELVAGAAAAQPRCPLAAKPELLAGLGAGRYGHGDHAVFSGYVYLRAQSRLRHGNRYLAVEVVALPLEEGVRTDTRDDVQVTRWPAAYARPALAREAHLGAVVHPGRYLDRQP